MFLSIVIHGKKIEMKTIEFARSQTKKMKMEQIIAQSVQGPLGFLLGPKTSRTSPTLSTTPPTKISPTMVKWRAIRRQLFPRPEFSSASVSNTYSCILNCEPNIYVCTLKYELKKSLTFVFSLCKWTFKFQQNNFKMGFWKNVISSSLISFLSYHQTSIF